MTTAMTKTAARLLLAPVLAVAAAVLVKASSQVGDGFTAGLIAVLAVVVQYLAAGPETTERWLPVEWAPRLAVAGLLIALAVAGQSLIRGEGLLTHWPAAGHEPAKLGTLQLSTHAAFELAVFLLVVGAVGATIRAIFRSDQAQGAAEDA